MWSHNEAFRAKSTLKEKLEAWYAAPAASTLYGSNSWAVTRALLESLRRWELKWLRKIFKFRWKPQEGRFGYNVRTARLLDRWKERLALPHLHHRLLRGIFKSAWRSRRNNPGGQLDCARRYEDHLWWLGVKGLPYNKHLREGALHWKQGTRPTFETILVYLVGEDWTTIIDGCSHAEWHKLTE